jgi:hypothetical protein
MALDRFIYFKQGKAPSLETIRDTLEDYLGGATEGVYIDNDRVFAVLRGKPSFPLKRIPEMAKYSEASEQHKERWLEVCRTSTSIDVITRMTDEYTNVVADGFVALVARFWKGKRDG